ncbi:hypothetical protein CAPTEDRAFT_209490 [Capitella teleta]|uniref:Uncharacterized protein n=1 Tax=Capitella teleta TaxID=283909 RepID=R7UGA7_CAPTE|nr:hypothetical protein CAPTEDRAFT_209490 [Capitella teleta]|eukprot:ELU02327.1 hypothetical protein CAPTEDRAFT_209490 [Capitella teleta]
MSDMHGVRVLKREVTVSTFVLNEFPMPLGTTPSYCTAPCTRHHSPAESFAAGKGEFSPEVTAAKYSEEFPMPLGTTPSYCTAPCTRHHSPAESFAAGKGEFSPEVTAAKYSEAYEAGTESGHNRT